MIKETYIELKELVRELDLDDINDELTHEDIQLWGYSSWEEFWENNM